MKTTETLIAGLEAQRAEHEQAGRIVAAREAGQEVIAHQTLARLRAQRAGLVERGESTVDVDVHISFWRGHVTEDVDPPATEQPAETGEAAATAPAATRRTR